MKILAFLLFILFLLVVSLCSIANCHNAAFQNLENPHILVKKKDRILQILDGEKLIKSYKISLGFAPEGDKEIEGDGKTPEGDFYIFTKNPESDFFLSLGVSYPNIEDAERGLKNGLISQDEYSEITKAISERGMPPQKTKLGGEIYIHGGGCRADWTAGCIALDNEEMQEIFDAIEIGTPIQIIP